MTSNFVLVISGFRRDDEAWEWFTELSENEFRVVMVNDDHPYTIPEILED